MAEKDAIAKRTNMSVLLGSDGEFGVLLRVSGYVMGVLGGSEFRLGPG